MKGRYTKAHAPGGGWIADVYNQEAILDNLDMVLKNQVVIMKALTLGNVHLKKAIKATEKALKGKI